MKNLSSYGNFVQDLNESKKSIDTSGIRKNLMHELLNIPEDKKISDVYKSGKKLAEDLVHALESKNIVPKKDIQAKAAQMLVFAGNWTKTDSKNSIFDVAARHVKSLF
jgi:Asp-tRNA(Asn)/Glu-tRNA(Gln) amidotransferase B subunit